MENTIPTITAVEKAAIAVSPFSLCYPPDERISTLVVTNFPALGRLAAMRFIEWVQCNRGGIISLPTGKTPEYFIKWVTHILRNWDSPETRDELEHAGVDPGKRPDMQSLYFVQIDEFYPIEPTQENSFHNYVNRFYVDGFGLDPSKALLINCAHIGLNRGQSLNSVWPTDSVDLSLRYRAPVSELERVQQAVLSRVDQWCFEYEERIRELGGIGFFLGGIGPDGHIGFNVRGSDHFSTTRLTEVNYETQAAAASDLGGIEVARRRLVITIGLGTITQNRNSCAIIIAAGESKAQIVAAAVQKSADIRYPGTALHGLPNARFYITTGAAKLLRRRRLEILERSPVVHDQETERIIVDLAVRLHKPIAELTKDDFTSVPESAMLLKKRGDGVEVLKTMVRERIEAKISRGTKTLSNTRFLHTEPHHDDLLLGYLPYIVRNVREASNTHFFACLTGGFTAVTNRFIVDHIARLRRVLKTEEFKQLMAQGYFNPDDTHARNRDVWLYLDGVAAANNSLRDEGSARRFFRNLIAVYEEISYEDSLSLDQIGEKLNELDGYFGTHYPGQRDSLAVQQLKSLCREWEAECLWGYFGWECHNVRHLRLGFYTGDIFPKEPTVDSDVVPVLRLITEVRPDVLGVALDPEASGPDTHYKVLQAITEALRRYEQESGNSEMRVWGYRNVWYRFHPSEANIFVPVSLNMFATMHSAFMNTFISQREASFPSPEFEGPFSALAQRIQVDQYEEIKICLGSEWFQEHPSPLIRATRGLVFLDELSLPEFYQRSRRLQQIAQDS